MKIGAHISTAGGLLNVFQRAQDMGAECFQIFPSSPRMWSVPSVSKETAEQFKKILKKGDFLPSFVHAKYLCNIASTDGGILSKSYQALRDELAISEQLGLTGAVFHIGAPKDGDREQALSQVVDRCRMILDQVPGKAKLVLENSATAKKLGATLEEIARIAEAVNNKRLTVCLDTAHAFAAGYDLSTSKGVLEFIDKTDRILGLENVSVFHINESKTDYNSSQDKHENIGYGKIGNEGLKAFITHPRLQEKPFILEVPGLEGKGPDAVNIQALKKLAGL